MFDLLTNMQISWNLLSFLVLPMLAWYFLKRPKGIPPGPWLALPILGNLLSLRGNQLLAFKKMREKYGDIFSFYMGSRLVIVINGYEHFKATFVKNGNVFNDKVELVPGVDHNKGILLGNGKIWKEQRAFSIKALKSLDTEGNILEERIQEEIRIFIDRISVDVKGGRAFDPHHILVNAFTNIICATVFGKRFELDDPQFVKFSSHLKESTESVSIASFYPFMKYLPGCLSAETKFNSLYNQCLNGTIKPSIDEHIARNNAVTDSVPNDFIDAFLKEMNLKKKDCKTESFADTSNLQATVFDLFVAGTETGATTLRWALLYLMHFPQIQERCFQEIEKNVGRERMPSMQDRSRLTYVEATIQEVIRIAAIVPFAMPHAVAHDVNYAGYMFPKGVMVIPNIHSILSDPDVFEEPDSFQPERFLDDEGKLRKPKEFIPFLIGRRTCIGEHFTQTELLLFVSSLIQKYEIRQEKGQELSPLKGSVGVVCSPHPFKVLFVPRSRC